MHLTTRPGSRSWFDRVLVLRQHGCLDLVMRGLSHYWRVTRQDNIVAQALLEKAIAIDPNYGQALGVLATSHTFSAHMGWADMATTAPIAERAARAAIRADSEDPAVDGRRARRACPPRRDEHTCDGGASSGCGKLGNDYRAITIGLAGDARAAGDSK